MTPEFNFTARHATDYNALTRAQRDEFHRLTDAGQPVPAALYAARQIITDQE